MEIEYKLKDGIFCDTHCLNQLRITKDGPLIYVGTIECVICRFFGNRINKNTIICDYKQKENLENEIDLSKCPKNEAVDVYCPDGSLLVRTDDEVVFSYIRKEIAKHGLEGYYVMFRGCKYPINIYGVIEVWPDGLMDTTEKMACEILRYAMERNNINYKQRNENGK